MYSPDQCMCRLQTSGEGTGQVGDLKQRAALMYSPDQCMCRLQTSGEGTGQVGDLL